MRKTVLLLVTILFFVLVLTVPMSIYAETSDDSCETYEGYVYEYEDKEENSTRSIPGGQPVDGEQWYDLSFDDEGNLEIPSNLDYSAMPELLTYLKPGDIIYERNGSFLADWVGHIAIVVDVVNDPENDLYYVLLLEAGINGVTYGLMTPNRFQEKWAIAVRLTDASDLQKENAIAWAATQLNKPWMLKATKSFSQDNTYWYCSELVWASFYSQGIYLDANDNLSQDGSIIYPEEIYEYSNAATILHSDYDTSLTVYDDIYHTYACDGDSYYELHNYSTVDSNSKECLTCGYIHYHNYTNRYTSINSTSHYAYCVCGVKVAQSHSFELNDGFNTCINCNYSIEENHEHSYTYVSLGNGRQHTKSCSCGDSVKEMCVGRAMIGGVSYCINCGQTINSILSLPDSDVSQASVVYKKDDEEV